MDAYTRLDALGIFLSGGATNISPAASLGGTKSSKAVRGMTPQYTEPVQGLIVEDATPENGEGIGQIAIVGDTAQYTPPGDTAGPIVTITGGQRKVLVGGSDATKAVRIYRAAGQTFAGLVKFRLLDTMSGVFGMGDVSHADRVLGETFYRAVFLKALGAVEDVKLWCTTDGQAAWGLAKETPSGDSIQSIPDEETAPTGLSWESAVDEASALQIGDMALDALMGLWIGKLFPASSTVAQKETLSLHIKFRA
jgi:hypothetical protein